MVESPSTETGCSTECLEYRMFLVYYSIRRQDDGNAAIANTNTSKLGAVVCWCPDVYSARPISHVFPSLGFPDLR